MAKKVKRMPKQEQYLFSGIVGLLFYIIMMIMYGAEIVWYGHVICFLVIVPLSVFYLKLYFDMKNKRRLSSDYKATSTMISEESFNLLKEYWGKIDELLLKLRENQALRNALNDSADKMVDVMMMYGVLQKIFFFDLKRYYEKMSYPVNFYMKTPESRCLFVVVWMLTESNADEVNYEQYKKIISGYNKELYESVRSKFYQLDKFDMSFEEDKNDYGMIVLIQNSGECSFEAEDYKTYFFRLMSTIAKVDGNVSEKEKEVLEQMMKRNESSDEEKEREYGETMSENELNKLIGLNSVKEAVRSLSNLISIRQKRESMNLPQPKISYHCVFTGNPGTGKTTVARILAGIYHDKGILKRGHLVETDRSGLVAEFVGQTAVKTNHIVDKALDGVLFIDEAYSLVSSSEEDYGKEAVATLLKRMEDDRDRLIVILAGYNNEMEAFINSNPGLRSRFNRYIEFPDYNADELLEIFMLSVRKYEYVLEDTAKSKLLQAINAAVGTKGKDFGNARFIRNLFEKTVERQANRLAPMPNPKKEDLLIIKAEDIPE